MSDKSIFEADDLPNSVNAFENDENADQLWQEILTVASLPEGVYDPQDLISPQAEATMGSPIDARVESDSEVEKAWEALRTSGLLLGPDKDILKVDTDLVDEEDELDDSALINLAHQNQLDEQMVKIGTAILERAPEHKVQPSISRVKAVLELLGNPQNTYQVVHITGTNGKTTTTRVVEQIIRESGLRTGRFTSPHLHTMRERIVIDGENISVADFIATWQEIEPYVRMVESNSANTSGTKLSFFEILTVMAYVAFANAPVDVAVVEVGMGGRWDATNVADGQVAVITPIALDHEKWLGASVTEIATEKVGIIKPKASVVSAEQIESVQAIIAQAVQDNSAYLVQENKEARVLSTEFAVGGQIITLQTPNAIYEDLYLPLAGVHQAHNVLLAVLAVEAFFGQQALSATVIEEAIAQVKSPGRIEIVRSSPLVIVDAGHNPHGVQASLQALENHFGLRKVIAVYSAMADKDIEGVLDLLEPMVEALVLVEMDNPRAAKLEYLETIAQEVFGEDRVYTASNLSEAITKAADLAETDLEALVEDTGVIVLGSVYIAAQARQVLGVAKAERI